MKNTSLLKIHPSSCVTMGRGLRLTSVTVKCCHVVRQLYYQTWVKVWKCRGVIKNKHTTRTTNMRNLSWESVSSLINRFRDAGLVCHTTFQKQSNHCYLLDFFRIPFRGALLFLLAGASSKRLLCSACVSKLSFLASVRSFSNLSRALKCCACKYKLCSIAKRSLLSNSSTRLLSSTGEGACLAWAEWPSSFKRSSCVTSCLAPLSSMWLNTRKHTYWLWNERILVTCGIFHRKAL